MTIRPFALTFAGWEPQSAFEEDNPITLLTDFYYANAKNDDDIPRVVMGFDNGVAECPKMRSSRHHNDPILKTPSAAWSIMGSNHENIDTITTPSVPWIS